MNISRMQEAIGQEGCDAWLFFDHHRRDSLAYRILDLPDELHSTRRWFYLVPASGNPIKLVHQIESHTLEHLPGVTRSYSRWQDLHESVLAMLKGYKQVAMQYSPDCAIPYVSMIDGGTLELIRSCGVQVISSANLVQLFEARWSAAQLQSHLEAGKIMDRIRAAAFSFIASGSGNDEFTVKCFLRDAFAAHGLITDHGPIVAVNENASDPHYEPSQEKHRPIRLGDLILIDMWAKFDRPQAVYYDITWTGYKGESVPEEIQKIFHVVTGARNCAVNLVQERVKSAKGLQGFEVDDAARTYIAAQGYGEHFIHRTGHSIGTDVHGAGANMDNYETHDERSVISQTCFSIEPGVYLPAFGIRSEVNVYVGLGEAQVTGEMQSELLLLS
ncbi:MAG: M24 family metallopeptidase [Bryobacteraceae bacterium]